MSWPDGRIALETINAPHRPSLVYLFHYMYSQDGRGLLSKSKFWVALVEASFSSFMFVLCVKIIYVSWPNNALNSKDLFCENCNHDR